MKKEYSTNGFVIHKKAYLFLLCLWFVIAIIAFILRINEIWRMEQKTLSLSALVALFIVAGYMLYVVKSSMVKLEINDDGIKYESSMRKGLLFQRTSLVVSWKSIKNLSILDTKNGPLKIDAVENEIIYWNIVNPRENSELYDFVNSVIKKMRAKQV